MENNLWMLCPDKKDENFIPSNEPASRHYNTNLPNRSSGNNQKQSFDGGQLISCKNTMFPEDSLNQQGNNFINLNSKALDERNIPCRVPLEELDVVPSSETPYYSVTHSQKYEPRPSVTFAATPNTYGSSSKHFPTGMLPSNKQSTNLLASCNSNQRVMANSACLSASKHNQHIAYQTARPCMENISSQPLRPVPQTPVLNNPWLQNQHTQQKSNAVLRSNPHRLRNEKYSDSLHDLVYVDKSNIKPEYFSASKQSKGASSILENRLLQSASKCINSSIQNESFASKETSFTIPSFMRKLNEAHAFLSQLPLRVDTAAGKVSDDDDEEEEDDSFRSHDKGTSGFHEASIHNSRFSENNIQEQLCDTNIFDSQRNNVPERSNIQLGVEKVNCFKEQLKSCLPELVDIPEMYPLVNTVSGDIPRSSVADVFSSRTPISSSIPYFSNSCIPTAVNNTFCRTVKQKNDSSSNLISDSFAAPFPKHNIDLLGSIPLDSKREQNYLSSAFPIGLTKNASAVGTNQSHNVSQNSINLTEEKRQLSENNASSHSNNLFPFSLTKEQPTNIYNSTPLQSEKSLGHVLGRGCSSINSSNSSISNNGKQVGITNTVMSNVYSTNIASIMGQSSLPVSSNKVTMQPQTLCDGDSIHKLENRFSSNLIVNDTFGHYKSEIENCIPTDTTDEFVPTTSSAKTLDQQYQNFSSSLNNIFEGRARNYNPETTSDLCNAEQKQCYTVENNVSGLVPSVKVNIKLDSKLQSCFESTGEIQKELSIPSSEAEKKDEQSSLNHINSNQEGMCPGEDSKIARKPDVISKNSLSNPSLSTGNLQTRQPSISIITSTNNASSSGLHDISSSSSLFHDKIGNSVLSQNTNKSLEQSISAVKNAVVYKTQKQISSDNASETDIKDKRTQQRFQETLPAFADSKILQVNGKSYVILGMLGKGGSSKVFQVYEPEKKKILAVKCVNLEGVDETMKSGFTNEIALLCKLQGSNHVIKLYDYENANKQLLVVLEKGDTDLSSLLRSVTEMKKVTPTMIKFYWSQMLEAVADIHKAGIIHSDLKPANFLLVAGQLKLIDFGIASAVQNDMTSVIKDSQMGTVNFMSPEAIQDTRQSPKFDDKGIRQPQIKISVKSDVWSLGCMLYNLVYGHTPFQHIPNILAKVNAIVNPNYQIPFQDIDDLQLLDVLKSCLIRDPKKRPSIEELLAHPYLTSEGNKDIGASVPSDKKLRSVIARLQTLTPRRIGRIAEIVENLQLDDDTRNSQSPENVLRKSAK